MANVGSATLTIVPKMPGFSAAVRSELKKVQAESAGRESGGKFGDGYAKGFSAKQGIVIGAFSAITSKAMSAVSSSMDAAISRFDTMNNFPTVMQNLGYSADEADASINRMSDRLQNLPTTLDAMVSSTQRLVSITGDINIATDAALALNDMLVASGSSTAAVVGAQEQFNQMLSKGKPDMQDWKSLISTMPGQMDQLAKSMLGPTATANDLYTALGGGGAKATISMEELLNEVIRLDTEGGPGFASFQDQAETAAGGVATSMSNMRNAVTKGIASVMDEIGKENIAGVFNDIKGGINEVFKGIRSAVPMVLPALQSLFSLIKQIGPAVLAGGGAVFAVNKLSSAFSTLKGAFTSLASPMGLATAGLGLLVTGAMLVKGAFDDANKRIANAEKATTGLADAVKRTASLDEYSAKVDNIGSSATSTAMSLDELNESIAKSVDRINDSTSEAETQIAALNSAQSIISKYAGQTDLSADAQGRLEYALKTVNEQFGLQLSAADVAAGYYTDQNGAVQDLVSSIENLIAAKKREIELDAMSSTYSEALKNEKDAADAWANGAEEASRRASEAEQAALASGLSATDASARGDAAAKEYMDTLWDTYQTTKDVREGIETEYGYMSMAGSESATAWQKWGSTVAESVNAVLKSKGGMSSLTEDLEVLGADTGRLAELTEEETLRIANAYDGTASSIVEVLAELGVSMANLSEETRTAMSDIQSSIEEMDISTPLEEAGVNIDQFSLKLAEAGVSTEQLNSIGSENLAALAESCGGNISLMIAHIQSYNDTPLYDKDGRVSMDTVTLMDAQGQLYTWNGSTLVDKDGQAVVNRVELEDAQGALVTWNGTALESKDGTAIVQGNMAEAIETRDSWNNGNLFNKECTATINVVRNISTNNMNAAGGYRMNASGGIRYHADGFIATRAMALPPTDIVGEAGAEAIVPLTNRTYAQPFIDMLVEGIKESLADHTQVIQQEINFNQPIKRPYDVTREMRRYANYGLAATR